MKKFYLSFVMLATIATVSYAVLPEFTDLPNAYGEQLKNSTFDGDWETTNNEPADASWHSFNTALFANMSSATTAQFNFNTTTTRPGSKTDAGSARLSARSVLGVIANGNATTGQIYADVGALSSTADSRNLTKCYNRTVRTDSRFNTPFESKPDSVTVWVNFQPINTTSQYGRVSVFIHGDANFQDPPSTSALRDQVIAFAGEEFLHTGGWVRKSIPFQYENYESFIDYTNSTLSNNTTTYPTANVDPKYIITTVATNRVPGGNASDVLYMDDFLMIYKPTVTPSKLAFTTDALQQGKIHATLSYTLVGTMSPYNLNAALNEVIAELSDANGSFDNPIELGRITSDVSGELPIMFPENIPFVNGYKIRIRTTNYPLISETSIEVVLPATGAPATDVTLNSFTANWLAIETAYGNPHADLTGFRIELYNVNDQIVDSKTTGAAETSVAFAGLDEGAYYYYIVSALYGEFEGASEKVEVFTMGDQFITWEQGDELATMLSNQTLVLTAVSSAYLPIVYVSSNENVAKIIEGVLVAAGPGTATISATQPGNSFITPAEPVSFTVTFTMIAPETLPNSDNNDTNSTANWTPAGGISSYNLQLFDTANNRPIGPSVTLPADALSHTFTGLTEATSYYYTLTAVSGDYEIDPVTSTTFITRKQQSLVWNDQKVTTVNTGSGGALCGLGIGCTPTTININTTAPVIEKGVAVASYIVTQTTTLGGAENQTNNGARIQITGTNDDRSRVGDIVVTAAHSGNDEWMPYEKSITVTVCPYPPGSPTVSLITGSSFRVVCADATSNAGNAGYNFYLSTDGVNFELVASTQSNASRTHDFINLQSGSTYYYRVYSYKMGFAEPERAFESATFVSGTVTTASLSIGELAEEKDFVQGKAYSIPYLVGGAGSGNNIIAELSDKDGSFNNAVEIGRIASTASGNVNITIPEGTVFGTNYQIRLRSTNPAMTSQNVIEGIAVVAPEALPATANSYGGCMANWKDLVVSLGYTPTGFTGYRIAWFNIDGTPINSQDVGIDVTSFEITGLTAGISGYSYTVSSIVNGEYSYGETITFYTVGGQFITWNDDIENMDINQTLVLTASASSNLPISYHSSDENVAKIVDGVLIPVGPGFATIYAEQAGGNGIDAAVTLEKELYFYLHAPATSANNPNNNDNSTAVWAASVGATSYTLRLYSTDNTLVGGVAIRNIIGLNYQFTGLEEGTPYYYTVQAVNGNWTSAVSEKVNFTTRKSQTVTWENKWAPMRTSTGTGNINYDTPSVNPSASSGLTAFTYSRVSTNLGTGAVTVSNINVNGRVVGQETIRAIQAGNSEWMPDTAYITVNVYPTNPTVRAITVSNNTTGTGFTITGWGAAPSNTDGFAIYQSNDGGETFSFVANVAANSSHTFTGLEPNTEYISRIYVRLAGTPADNYLSKTYLENITTTPARLRNIIYMGVAEGEHSNQATYREGDETTFFTLSAASREDDIFLGWYLDAGYTEGNDITEINAATIGDQTLYAKWEESKVQVTYHNVEGIAHNNPAEYPMYSAFTLDAPTGERTGYTFGGWFKNEELTQSIIQITKNDNVDLDLYAKWNVVEYNIAYENMNGAANANQTKYTIETETIELADLGNRDGYTFGGWYSDALFENAIVEITKGSTGDTILYAKWNMENYNIIYHNVEAIDANPNPATYTIESEITLQPIAERLTHLFAGWFSDEQLTDTIDAPAIAVGSTGAREFWAKWTPKQDVPECEYEGLPIPPMPPMPKGAVFSLPYTDQVLTSNWTDSNEPLNWNLIAVGLEGLRPIFNYPTADWYFDAQLGTTATVFQEGIINALMLPVLDIPARTTELQLSGDFYFNSEDASEGSFAIIMLPGEQNRFSACEFMFEFLPIMLDGDFRTIERSNVFQSKIFDLTVPAFEGEERTLNIVIVFLAAEENEVFALKNVKVTDPNATSVAQTTSNEKSVIFGANKQITIRPSATAATAAVSIHDVMGRQIYAQQANGQELHFSVSEGVYIARIGTQVEKVFVK